MKPFRKKRTMDVRRPKSSVDKSSAYHYSARRSDAEKNIERSSTSMQSNTRTNPKQGARLHFVPFIIGLLGIVVSIVYLSGLSNNPQIIIPGAAEGIRSTSEYRETAKSLLDQSLLNKSKLTVNTQKIEDELVLKYPEITGVNITTPLIRHNPVITLSLSQPAIILRTNGASFLLDQEGRALLDINNAPKSQDLSSLPVLQDKSDVAIRIGKPALSASQVNYIYQVVGQSKNRGLTVSSMDLVAGGGELDVRYEGLGYFVKFNFFEDPRKSSGTFFATKERLELENKPPSEYVDVRVAERAYVK